MSEAAAAAPPAGGAKAKKGSPILPLLLVVNLGVTGFIAWKAMKPAPVDAGGGSGAHGGGHDGGEAGKGPGPLVKLDPFIVNLDEKMATRYLKVSFEVELRDAAVELDMTARTSQIRDELIRYLSSLKTADTLGAQGKEVIATEVEERIDAILGEGAVKGVYFAEFVTQ